MKYYLVKAFCGHVGRGYAVEKVFGVKASSKKEAAAKARLIPRVKHDYKFAIRDVWEVSLDEYWAQIHFNDMDPFLKATNSWEQLLMCPGMKVIKLDETDNIRKYSKSHKVSHKKYVLRYSSDNYGY